MRIYGASAGAHWGSAGQQSGGLSELQEEARRRWRALSSEEQEEAGGYNLPMAAQGGQVMGQRFVKPNKGMPERYNELRDLMMQQSMAGVSADFGRRGMMSSSLYGAASATAGAKASLAAWQMYHQERQLNLQRTQVRQQGRLARAGLREQRAQLGQRRAEMREEYRFRRKQLRAQDDWREIRQGMTMRRGRMPSRSRSPWGALRYQVGGQRDTLSQSLARERGGQWGWAPDPGWQWEWNR